jgi:hypothetical protein
LQDPSEANEDNLSDVRQEAIRHFRNKKREYLKDKINELESNSKNKNIRDLYRGINEFKKGYQPRTNLVKDKRGDLLADPDNILNRWKNYFCQLLNLHGAGSVRQTEMPTAVPFVTEPSASEVEVAIVKLERYKSPGVDQIPAELIQAGVETLHSEIHKLGVDVEQQRIALPVERVNCGTYSQKRAIKLVVVIIEAHLAVNFIQNFIKCSSLWANFVCG